jgi:RNA-directed DNA polymerase
VQDLYNALGLVLPEGSLGRNSYFRWRIPKKSGGYRLISAPRTELKAAQHILAVSLQGMHEPRPSAHGFIPARSIVTNAARHVDRRWVFNLDLEDFFGSISTRRVATLLASAPFYLNPTVARGVASICTLDGCLPTGSPSSPVLSNMVARKFDGQLQEFAHEHRAVYSRYVDDLTFSTNLPQVEEAIAVQHLDEWFVGGPLHALIVRNGFRVNVRKVRMQHRSVKQTVTGLVTNERVNVDRRDIRAIRGALHAWHTYGYDAAQREFMKRYNTNRALNLERVLRGRIAFIRMVRGKDDPIAQKLLLQLEMLVATGRRFPPDTLDEPR